jgi:ribulose-phosphate 3-epimerase
MSVEPGFGGQKFMPQALQKIRELRQLKTENKYGFDIEVDGGIIGENAAACIEAGADVLVSGSFVTGSKNMKAAMAALRGGK